MTGPALPAAGLSPALLMQADSIERPRGEVGDPEHQRQVREAATRFEGLLVGQLLAVLRSTAGEGGMFSGPGAELYGQLFDQHMGDAMARGGGIGLADVLATAMDPTLASGRPLDTTLPAWETPASHQGTRISRADLTPRPPSGADVPGATGLLQSAARQMLPASGVATQWGRDGTLTPEDLASEFTTQAEAGPAAFSVRDAGGFQGSYKCNLFAMELARRAGFQVPVVPRRAGWGYVGPTGLTADAADGTLRGDWARVVGDESAASLDASIVHGERAFMLTAGPATGEHGHMGIVERIHEIERDAQGDIVRIVFDGWEGRSGGAMHLERRTWASDGHGRGAALTRGGLGQIELVELQRPAEGQSVERPLRAGARASLRDRPTESDGAVESSTLEAR